MSGCGVLSGSEARLGLPVALIGTQSEVSSELDNVRSSGNAWLGGQYDGAVFKYLSSCHNLIVSSRRQVPFSCCRQARADKNQQ